MLFFLSFFYELYILLKYSKSGLLLRCRGPDSYLTSYCYIQFFVYTFTEDLLASARLCMRIDRPKRTRGPIPYGWTGSQCCGGFQRDGLKASHSHSGSSEHLLIPQYKSICPFNVIWNPLPSSYFISWVLLPKRKNTSHLLACRLAAV